MTRAHTGPPWHVVLIVEDDSDGRALRALARASGLGIRVDWLPANGIGNIKRKCDALIQLALDRIQDGKGCVAVIVDRDGKDRRRDEPHHTIHSACAAQGTPFVEATEALESWFLSDDGIVTWLGLTPRPDVDRLRDPKGTVARAFQKKTKRPYRKRRARVQVAEQATGLTGNRSPSLRSAIAHLERCGVVASS